MSKSIIDSMTNCLWCGNCLSSLFSCFVFPWPLFIPIRLFSSFISFLIILFSVCQRYFFRFFINLFSSSNLPSFIAFSHLFLFAYLFHLPHLHLFVVPHPHFLIFYFFFAFFHNTSLKFSVSAFSSSSFPFTMFILNWVFPASPFFVSFCLFFGPDGVVEFVIILIIRDVCTNFV